MYAPFFGLQQEAFSIAPDPRFLHLSAMHREALAHLLYGLQGGGGFVLLTGDIGTGKTTVCRAFLEQMPHDHRVAYVVNPEQTPPELLQTVCQEFGIALPDPPPATLKPYVDALNQFLLDCHARGLQCLLVVDEAQALSARLLELLRLLTNLETSDRKLLQIMLIGQPELRDKLAQPELEQLSQRVIARVHLGPLGAADTALYVQHRLAVAGLAGESPFDARALQAVYRLSGGVPRRINLLCDRTLLGGYATGQQRIGVAVVERAAAEVFGTEPAAPAAGWAARAHAAAPWAGGVAAGLGLAALAWWLAPGAERGPAVATAAPVASAVAASVPAAPAAPAAPARTAATTAPPRPAPAPPLQALDADALRAAFAGQLRGEPDARRELAAAWGLALRATGDPCVAAAREGVACFKAPTSLATVRQLDRPGLLTLHDGSGKPYQVLLTALGPDSATLTRGNQRVSVPLASLGAAWRGEFATFWRAPAGYAGSTALAAPGGSGAAWLAARLAEAQPAHAAASAPLAARVAAFQVAEGLPPDGVPGPMTLMLLNRATGVDEPRLARP